MNLPDGAVILGVRFFGYDASANDAALHLISFNGAGDLVDILNISSSTSGPGYFSAYGTLTTPITINNANQAISLVWYPYEASSQLLLCGARILYIPPFPPAFSSFPRGLGADQGIGDGALPEPSRVRNFTTFIAGHDFLPRNAASSYMYGGAGCIASSSGGMVVADADLPEGASLYGVRLFYYDVSATSGMSYFTTTYDGFGNTTDILSGWVDSETPGYSSFYKALSPAHLVNQLSNSMVVQAQLPLDINVRLCGIQLLWSMPVGLFRANTGAEVSETGMEAPHPPDSSSAEQRTMALEYHYRFIAGSAFQPRTINTTYTYNMAGCVRLNEGMILTVDLQLPAGALLRGVRVYTYDTSTGKSTLFTTDYNWVGGFNEFLIGDTVGSTGYSQTFFEKIPSYTVDTFKPIALVWNGGGIFDGTMQLCGMRVFYSIERNLYGTYLPMIRGQ